MRIALLLLSVFCLAGCTKVAFEPIKKLDTLKTSNVFGGSDTGATSNTPPGSHGGGLLPAVPVGDPGTTAGTTGPKNPPSTTGTVSNGNVEIPVTRFCSDAVSKMRKTNMNAAQSLKLQLINSSNIAVCTRTDTAQIKNELSYGTLKFSSCNPANGQYQLNILDHNNLNLLYHSGSASAPVISVNNGSITLNQAIKVLVDSNPNENDTLPTGMPEYSGITCDQSASPLYVDFRKDRSQATTLSSKEDGVMFDILGANGSPAYSKDQISWFKSPVFALLALPNQSGKVNGIDELFGDNTLGKDGKFADNGFLALAKYDDNGDQVIDSKDEVFSHLRLWFDFNRDGIASQQELVSLSQKRIVAIDLNYDPNYYEVDKYGNEIKFKSVVKFASGAYRSIFDVWFKL